MEEKIPVYEFIVDEDKLKSDEMGLTAISIVYSPAILVDFLRFENQEKLQFKISNKEKCELVGPAMIPGMRIYRNDQSGEYYGYFSKETIYKMVQSYFKKGKLTNFNLNHSDEVNSGDVYIIESWFASEGSKDKQLGFSLPDGTWFITVKVENQDIWNKYLATNELRGFSVECFADSIRVFSKEKQCKITAQDVTIAKMKNEIMKEELYNFKIKADFALEYYNSQCRCNHCRELKSMGYCLPGVLPDDENIIKKGIK